MLNSIGEVIYVGKARNLKNRVSSYFKNSNLPQKTKVMLRSVERIETIITNSENEALILECNLIKQLKPRYNILLRDDKSYPYIVLTHHNYPRLASHRGRKQANDRYFGPYPSGTAVRETVNLLQKLFKLRSCSESFFRNRNRPCLQYQIKRCTAPCVNYISESEYHKAVQMAELFLTGKSQQIIEQLTNKMEQASGELDFEAAAKYRDQLISLRRIQEQQFIATEGGDIDIIAVTFAEYQACVQCLFIRQGRMIGNKAFFPKVPANNDQASILPAFISQYYLSSERATPIPEQIIISSEFNDQKLFEEVLSERRGKRVKLQHNVRAERVQWLKLASKNASLALSQRLADQQGIYKRFEALQAALYLNNLPNRIECFDVSHTSGKKTVASCVVFGCEGAIKSDYRRFNITQITGGDDYAAMRQALQRRYTKLKQNEAKLPDILIIDGGKGQLSQAEAVLEELQINNLQVIAVAKGPTRKAGLETLILANSRKELELQPDHAALHLIQHIRDEAHRFAITGHRQRRQKQVTHSALEDIEGIGAKRRQQLLRHFGGLQEIKRASVVELAKVNGISLAVAQKIFDFFH